MNHIDSIPQTNSNFDHADSLNSMFGATNSQESVRSHVHDLNNSLMVATSYCEFLVEAALEDSRHRAYATKAHSALLKAAGIAKQISAAARECTRVYDQRPLELDGFLSGLLDQLSIRVEFRPDANNRQVDISGPELARLVTETLGFLRSPEHHTSFAVYTGVLHAQGALAFSDLPQGKDYVWISITADDEDGAGKRRLDEKEIAFKIPQVTTRTGAAIMTRPSVDSIGIVLYIPCLDAAAAGNNPGTSM